MDIQLKKRPWYIKHIYLIIGVACIAALITYALVITFRPKRFNIDPLDDMIAEVTEASFMEYMEVEGLIQPIRTVKVNTLEDGFVERIVAEEGAILNTGDTILILSNIKLQRTIEEEEAEWLNRQRNYQEQEIEMEQRSISLREQALDARHQISSLDKSLNQSREEYEMGIKSKAELEVMEEDYEYRHQKMELQMQNLRHDSVATRLKREMIRADREASERKLKRTASRTANLIVRAPVDGQLSYLNVTIGQQVGAGTTIGELKVMTEFKLQVSLSEYYIDRVTNGLPAIIRDNDKQYPLKISKVVPEVKNRNFTCDLRFTGEQPSNIRIGKSYRIQIEMAKPEKSLVIPQGDFFSITGGRWIYRLSSDNKTLLKTEIEIGRQNPKQYEIISGLNPGDKVLINGYEKLGNMEEISLRLN